MSESDLTRALREMSRHFVAGAGEAGHIDPVNLSLLEMPRNNALACAVVGVLANPSRARNVATADLQERPFETISHSLLP